MTMPAFLAELRRRGVVLWVDGNQVRYRAPRGAVTPELLETMRLCKEDLLQYLRYTADPRAEDLREDTHLWAGLLRAAFWLADADTWSLLHGLRCGGARLEVDKAGRLRFLRGDWPEEDWKAIKRHWLATHAAQLRELLDGVQVGGRYPGGTEEIVEVARGA